MMSVHYQYGLVNNFLHLLQALGASIAPLHHNITEPYYIHCYIMESNMLRQ